MTLSDIKRKSVAVYSSKTFAVYAAAFIALVGEFCMFAEEIGSWSSWKIRLMTYSADAMVTCSFFLMLPRRTRGLIVIYTWISAIYLFASSVYYRFAHDLLSLKLIFSIENYNGLVFSSVPSLLKWRDLSWLICPAIPTAVMTLHGRRKGFERIGIAVRSAIAALSLAVFAISYLKLIDMRWKWTNDPSSKPATTYLIKRNFTDISTRWVVLHLNGHVINFIYMVYDLFASPAIELDDKAKARIKTYLAGIPTYSNPAVNDSCRNDPATNLILVVVESLDASVIGHKIDGRSVTPVIDSLLTLDGTISALHMVSQIADGSSSDGQLMYNTGLLPMRNGATSTLFGDNTYMSLARLLDVRTAEEFIGEESSIWNHQSTSKSYGYDHLWTCTEINKASGGSRCSDAEIFRFAANRMKAMPEPFMAFITTLTSHFPYDKPTPGSEWIEPSSLENDYYRSINYFDRELGRFINELHSSGLLQRSVIVIASDHDAPRDMFHVNTPAEIVFMALNTGMTRVIEDTFGQIDIFPTILDLMGTDSRWRGLGQSIITGSPKAAIDRRGQLVGTPSDAESEDRLREARDISDLIIRSNYFSTWHETDKNH